MIQQKQWEEMKRENESLKRQMAQAGAHGRAAMKKQEQELEAKHAEQYRAWEDKNLELRVMLQGSQAHDDAIEDQQIAELEKELMSTREQHKKDTKEVSNPSSVTTAL